jgi:hypothetical protein
VEHPRSTPAAFAVRLGSNVGMKEMRIDRFEVVPRRRLIRSLASRIRKSSYINEMKRLIIEVVLWKTAISPLTVTPTLEIAR